MDKKSLGNFGAYRKASELFDLVVGDCNRWLNSQECKRLVSQQLASSDSICANIEEGYGRLSKKKYVQFLVYSRGSAQETRGRYQRLSHWIPQEKVNERIALANEIIGILTSTIRTLRAQG